MLLFSPIVADSPTNQTNRRSLWNCLWEGSKIQSVALRRRTLQIAQQMYLRIIILMRAGPLYLCEAHAPGPSSLYGLMNPDSAAHVPCLCESSVGGH